MQTIDYTALKALDMLVNGENTQNVLLYLRDKAVSNAKNVSEYLCDMTYRLALSNVEFDITNKVLEEIKKIASENEKELING